jgi:hypothetical protein
MELHLWKYFFEKMSYGGTTYMCEKKAGTSTRLASSQNACLKLDLRWWGSQSKGQWQNERCPTVSDAHANSRSERSTYFRPARTGEPS